MKKHVTIAVFVLVVALLLTGCSLGGVPNVEIEVTPALTPLISTNGSGQAAAPGVSVAASSEPVLVVAGSGVISAVRTPMVVTVPLTPAPMNVASTDTNSQVDVPSTLVQAQNTPAPAEEHTGDAAPGEDVATPAPPAAQEEASAAEPTAEAYQGVPVSLDDTLNILVVGSDERRPGQPWRSDVIMLVAVDYANRQVGVVSFPRDMWVDIPTVGKNRINTATFFGGINKYPNGGDIGLLKDTLAQNFGIRVDHYMKFNFETFKDVIDALDGVDITVDCPITGRFPVEPGSKELKWQTLPAGDYHMDGEFALRYVRERKTTSDVDRNRRQQRVLIAMRKRAREVNIIPRLPALYDAMKENIETDLGLTDIIALARLGLQIDTKDVHGFNIGYKELDSWKTPGGAAVLRPDMKKIQEGLATLFSKPSILKNPSKPASCR